MKGVCIFLADGFEDMEALGTRDVLKRGGVDVQLVGIGDEPFVVSSHGLMVGIDSMLEDVDDSCGAGPGDVMIFPGGMPGSKYLASCKPLVKMMKNHFEEGGTLAAICAAPGLVLAQLDDLAGYECTCFDGFEQALMDKGARFVRKGAVTCGQIITGRSAGHAKEFGLEILKRVKGEETAAKVAYSLDLTCE